MARKLYKLLWNRIEIRFPVSEVDGTAFGGFFEISAPSQWLKHLKDPLRAWRELKMLIMVIVWFQNLKFDKMTNV